MARWRVNIPPKRKLLQGGIKVVGHVCSLNWKQKGPEIQCIWRHDFLVFFVLICVKSLDLLIGEQLLRYNILYLIKYCLALYSYYSIIAKVLPSSTDSCFGPHMNKTCPIDWFWPRTLSVLVLIKEINGAFFWGKCHIIINGVFPNQWLV